MFAHLEIKKRADCFEPAYLHTKQGGYSWPLSLWCERQMSNVNERPPPCLSPYIEKYLTRGLAIKVTTHNMTQTHPHPQPHPHPNPTFGINLIYAAVSIRLACVCPCGIVSQRRIGGGRGICGLRLSPGWRGWLTNRAVCRNEQFDMRSGLARFGANNQASLLFHEIDTRCSLPRNFAATKIYFTNY